MPYATAPSALGGSIDETELAFTDITTANASTSAHGLLPKLSNTSTEYLSGTGVFSTPAGFSYGASISGTTDAGTTITLSNSSADGAAALKLVAGNTQANQPVLANLQIGTSGSVQGLLIQGTGSYTPGAVGTGKTHLTLWENVDSADHYLLTVGNGTSFTKNFVILANGGVQFTTPQANNGPIISMTLPASTGGGYRGYQIVGNDTQTTPTCMGEIQIGSSGNIMGIMVSGTGSATSGAIGTGKVHCTLWANVNSSAVKVLSAGNGAAFAETAFLTADGNLSLGAAAIASGTQIVQVKTGTAPSSQTADSVSLYSSDDAAGHTIPSFYCEGTNVLATGQADSVSSVRVKMRINGTVVTLLAI